MKEYCYEYDSLDRLITSYTTIGDSVRTISEYEYDGKSRVSEYHCGMVGAVGGNLNQNYAYAYNDENGTLNSMTVSSGSTTDTLNYSYDAFQRLTSQTTVRTGLTLAEEYSYKNLSGNRTTTQVSGYTAKVNGSTVDSYTYTYDNLGNITAINRNGYAPLTYTYDAQNQLVSVLEGDFRYDFTYDTYGNILSVEYVEDYTDEVMSSNTYTYGNAQWVDQLTKFNGQSITYDEIGNPLSYYNGSRYTFTWNGRELATAVKGSKSISYKYGADGLRTQKTVGSTVYNYYYIDGLLVRQTWGTNYMDFLYDESGSPYSFIYNGTQYYYVKNLQGDVVKILNASGSVVANYYYDAWGKVTASSSIGQTNPIRYRGYYYDTETGFYYLQSRYYDPAIKRFINADGYVNANGDLLGFNMYAYCGNNPVMGYDPTGEIVIEAIIAGAFIGGILGAVNSVIDQLSENNGDWNEVNVWKVGVDFAFGAINGALASSGISLRTSIILGGALGAASSLVNDLCFDASLRTNAGYDWKQISGNILKNALIGMVSGAISGEGADCIKKGQHVTKFVNSKKILNRTIANNTKGSIAHQTRVMYHHAKPLVDSGIRYLISSAFNLYEALK